MAMGAWRSNGDATNMWDRTTSCIREAAREVLGGFEGQFWWSPRGLVVEWRSPTKGRG